MGPVGGVVNPVRRPTRSAIERPIQPGERRRQERRVPGVVGVRGERRVEEQGEHPRAQEPLLGQRRLAVGRPERLPSSRIEDAPVEREVDRRIGDAQVAPVDDARRFPSSSTSTWRRCRSPWTSAAPSAGPSAAAASSSSSTPGGTDHSPPSASDVSRSRVRGTRTAMSARPIGSRGSPGPRAASTPGAWSARRNAPSARPERRAAGRPDPRPRSPGRRGAAHRRTATGNAADGSPTHSGTGIGSGSSGASAGSTAISRSTPGSAIGPPREPEGDPLPCHPQRVVPAGGERREAAQRHVRELGPEQRTDARLVELDLRAPLGHRRHSPLRRPSSVR